MSGTITMTGEEYDAMAGELDRVSRELSCLQSVIAEPDELNAEPASDYETLRRQYLSLRLLTNSALARNRYLCRRDDRDMRAALSVNAANVSAERDTNAMLTDLLEKAEAERDALHAEAEVLDTLCQSRFDEIAQLKAEAEALRVALLEIASANPAERGIEWAKSYASDGLKGSGSELYARWLDTFKEAEALRAENGRLQADRDRANQYANQQALECNKLSTDLEAARGLLESAVVLFACHCTDATAKNWHDAAAAFLTATPAPEVQASGPYASVAGALAQRYPKPSLLKDCNVSYSNSSRPLAEQGERQEVWARQCDLDESDPALFVSRERVEESGYTVRLTTATHPGPDVRALAASLYQACGAYDMPERILDALSAAANGEPFTHMIDGLLPCVPPSGEGVRALVEALEECAASLAWNCFGECRAIHAGPIMPAVMALDAARTALDANRKALQGDSNDT